jgi:glycosyltransferase involved in cell wall biosynthesis/predicted SAM-dependent methyltransferase
MRIAFFSPLPPAKSGIADYSQALLEPLRRLADVEVFTPADSFHPERFDVALYQVGNNPHHSFAYNAALRHPGVVVLHESNLHHLIADITIRGGDWDGYLAEVEYNGGQEALAYARRVRALEVGPDYEGLPMLRRILERSRGVIVHSDCMAKDIRAAGFVGPIGRIPHGAWIPKADRWGYRQRLGLEPSTPLIGIFGFLKPYKRIAESLRAFRRLVRVQPQARMILVGEPHPEFAVERLIESLGLTAHVRLLGFTPIEDFTGYLAACDVVLNLRYPTVGESSGTLLRALGLGKAVLVSDVGSFCEFPDDVCLKVPVDAQEEDLLFEYLSLLVARREVAKTLGQQARQWVERECNWDLVARRYVCFLESVVGVREWEAAEATFAVEAGGGTTGVTVPAEYVLEWAADEDSRSYIETHRTRFEKTLAITPRGTADDRILEMGAYMQITPALKTRLGYGEVRGCYYGPAGSVQHKSAMSSSGEQFECDIDLFNAEKNRFPYKDEWFSTVLCCELLEHLVEDPMFMMCEINRVLKPGGHLVLTTPNIASIRAISAILQGYHPGFFPAYIRPAREGEEVEARHNREYTPKEVSMLLRDAGFETVLLETGEFRDELHPEHEWVLHLFQQYQLSAELRGDGIYAVGRKTGAVRERYPNWLYSGSA